MQYSIQPVPITEKSFSKEAKMHSEVKGHGILPIQIGKFELVTNAV